VTRTSQILCLRRSQRNARSKTRQHHRLSTSKHLQSSSRAANLETKRWHLPKMPALISRRPTCWMRPASCWTTIEAACLTAVHVIRSQVREWRFLKMKLDQRSTSRCSSKKTIWSKRRSKASRKQSRSPKQKSRKQRTPLK